VWTIARACQICKAGPEQVHHEYHVRKWAAATCQGTHGRKITRLSGSHLHFTRLNHHTARLIICLLLQASWCHHAQIKLYTSEAGIDHHQELQWCQANKAGTDRLTDGGGLGDFFNYHVQQNRQHRTSSSSAGAAASNLTIGWILPQQQYSGCARHEVLH